MHTNKAPFLAIAWMAIATCSVVVIVKAQTSGFQHYCLEHSAPQGSYVCVESRDGLIIQLQPSSNAYVQPGETVDYHERKCTLSSPASLPFFLDFLFKKLTADPRFEQALL